jgi:hypothetical protein
MYYVPGIVYTVCQCVLHLAVRVHVPFAVLVVQYDGYYIFLDLHAALFFSL